MEPLDVHGRTADGAFEEVGDVALKDSVGLEADGVLVALGLKVVVQVGHGEGGIAPEELPLGPFPISRHHGFQHRTPAIGAVDVAGTQRGPFQIAEPGLARGGVRGIA
jgi:hypothetical protein